MGRQPKHIPDRPPDLDAMSEDDLESFIRRFKRPSDSKNMFSSYPRNYGKAHRRIVSMAAMRLKYLQTNKYTWAAEYEKRYRTLPPYAQWRRWFNVSMAVMPGKKFRRWPPKTAAKIPLDSIKKRG